MDYAEFNRRLKETPAPPPALIFFGEEPYLAERGVELACEHWKLERSARFVGVESTWGAIETACASSFLGMDRRAVLVLYRSAAEFSNEHRAGLKRYLDAPSPASTLLVRIADENFSLKVPSAVWAIACGRPDFETLQKWLRREFAKRGHNLSPDAQAGFEQSMRGAPLHAWASAVDAISAHADAGATVERRDVEPFAGFDLDVNAFRLCDALVEGRAAAATQILDELLDHAADPLQILGALGWAYRKLLSAKLRRLRGQNRIEVARAIGVKFRAERYVDLADRLTLDDFERVHEVLLAADGQLKLRASARAARTVLETTVHTLVHERAGAR